MIRPNYFLLLFFALFLSACGGEDVVSVDDTTTDDATDTTTDDTTDDDTTTDTSVDLALGSGSGTDFVEGELLLSADYLLTGDSVTIEAFVVDKNSSNATITDEYWYQFESECTAEETPAARFSTSLSYSSAGSISTSYTNLGCTYTDTITVSLLASATNKTALATATASLAVITPVLGSGSGYAFSAGDIGGVTSLVDTTAVDLSVGAVDPENSNTQISSSLYRILWESSCEDASFSISSSSASGEVTTRYNTNLDSCLGANEITASLVLASDTDTLVATASTTINVSQSGTSTVNPVIGTGTGAEFFEGQLTLSAQQVLMGQTLTVSADGVDKSNANAQLSDEYKYVFSSTCFDEDTPKAAFTITETNSTTNSVTSTYRNLSCTGEDTIVVSLFAATADTDSDQPLDTASQTIEVAAPVLGSGDGVSFEEGAVDGETDLAGDEESEFTLNLVNPLDTNALVSSEDYTVEWFSSCDDDDFSVQKQNLESGEINTRYITDTVDCLGTNTISLILYGTNDKGECSVQAPQYCMDTMSFEVEVSQGVDPALGYVNDSSTFYEGELLVYGFRESQLSVMTEAQREAAEANLSARGTALIEVSVVDLNNSSTLISGTSYGYVISSNCVDDGIASFEEDEKITSSGSVSFTYTSETCEQDEFEVKLYRVDDDGAMTTRVTDTLATGIIYIESIEIGAISYEGATDTAISIATIGDAVLPKQTTLTFLVVDESGDPVVSKTVEFELTNTAGGTSLSQGSDVTDSSGEVNVIINAGSANAITSVRATTLASDGVTEITTSSQPISITTGLADQNSFEIVADLFNPAAYGRNGTEVNVTAYAADQYQNPVADGTIINFIAESGIIESSCETSGGYCSVVWISSGARPGTFDASLQRVNEIDPETGDTVLGMTTITAYTSGEAGYTDSNGNGQFDYRDLDSSGTYSPATVNDHIEHDINDDGLVDQDANSDGWIDVDSNNDGFIDVDNNYDAYIDTDLNGDDKIDTDQNGDGYIDVDLDGDGEIDEDNNEDGFVDVDTNDDGNIDEDSNSDGLIDVDLNFDSEVDEDLNADGYIDEDANDDGNIDRDINSDSIVDTDLNGDGDIDLDTNADGYIDEDLNADGNIDVDDNFDGYIDEDSNGDTIVDTDWDSDGIIDGTADPFNPVSYNPTTYESLLFATPTRFATPIAMAARVTMATDSVTLVEWEPLANWGESTQQLYAMSPAFDQAIDETAIVEQAVSGDLTEPYSAYPEVFRDDNYDGKLDTNTDGDPVEEFIDFNSDGVYTATPHYYQGAVCAEALLTLAGAKADDGTYDAHCKYVMHARDSLRIIQSVAQSAPVMTLWIYQDSDFVQVSSSDIESLMSAYSSATFYVLLQDANGNYPANGTSLSVTGDGYEIFGESGAVENSIGFLDRYNVSNLPTFGHLYTVQYAEDTDPASIELEASFEELSVGITLIR